MDARSPSPARVVVDAARAPSPESQLVRTAKRGAVIVAVAEGALLARRNALAERGCAVVAVPAREGRVDPRILMELLWQRFSLDSLIVEGGPTLLGSPFRRRFGRSRPSLHCAQDFRRLRSFGPRGGARGGGSGGCAPSFSEVSLQMMGGDVLLEGEASAMFTGYRRGSGTRAVSCSGAPKTACYALPPSGFWAMCDWATLSQSMVCV